MLLTIGGPDNVKEQREIFAKKVTLCFEENGVTYLEIEINPKDPYIGITRIITAVIREARLDTREIININFKNIQPENNKFQLEGDMIEILRILTDDLKLIRQEDAENLLAQLKQLPQQRQDCLNIFTCIWNSCRTQTGFFYDMLPQELTQIILGFIGKDLTHIRDTTKIETMSEKTRNIVGPKL